MPLVECVPNVSEGRRADVIRACAEAIELAGASLLDISSDAAHNRSVFTYVGQPDQVRDATLALFGAALPRIDLRWHEGVHPRIGAVDVVPFVPLQGATMPLCVALAREVGSAVAAQHGLPVFLYEEAASAPHRRQLQHVRRGQFEGLGQKLLQTEWHQDFGPSQPHPTAGATAVGARRILVAFNVNLRTERLDVAKAVASAVRESSGGLRCVKALGLPLVDRGLVQVSMNLTNLEVTSIAAAFDAVVHAAAAYDVAIAESEVVGLVPAAALGAAGARYLALPHFRPGIILEHQLLDRPRPDQSDN